MKKLIYAVVVIIIFAIAFTINLKNPQSVTLFYYFGIEWQTKLMWALTAAFGVGLLIGWLIMTVSVLKNKRQVGKAKKQLAKVEQEVENLRAMPISNEA